MATTGLINEERDQGGTTAVSDGERLEFLKRMLLIRRFEEAAFRLQSEGVVVGELHGSYGLEAVAVGVCAAMEPGDYLAATHRNHSQLIARGMDMRSMMAELAGRQTGACKAKGGSMNLSDRSLNILGGNNVVGISFALAAGAALAAQCAGDSRRIAVAFSGEGGSSTGVFHETLNLAALWKLPVVFVVENNHYCISTPLHMQVAGGDIAGRAAGYGIPGVAVDGNDPEAVYSAAVVACRRARSGEGPSLIVADTYRLGGHWGGDWGGYRDEAEVQAAEKTEPVKVYMERLESRNLLNASVLSGIEGDIAAGVQTAVDFAMESALAIEEDVYGDVFVSNWVGYDVDNNIR